MLRADFAKAGENAEEKKKLQSRFFLSVRSVVYGRPEKQARFFFFLVIYFLSLVSVTFSPVFITYSFIFKLSFRSDFSMPSTHKIRLDRLCPCLPPVGLCHSLEQETKWDTSGRLQL